MENSVYKIVKDPLSGAKYIADTKAGIIYLDISPVQSQIKNSRQWATRAVWNHYLSLIKVDKKQAITYLKNNKVRRYRTQTNITVNVLVFALFFVVIFSSLWFLTKERDHVYITNSDTTIVKEPPYIDKKYIDSIFIIIKNRTAPVMNKIDSLKIKQDSLWQKMILHK